MLRRLLSVSILFILCCTLLAQPPAEIKPSFTFKGHTDPVYAVSYSPDGSVIATGSFDKTIKLWNGTNGKELRTLAGPQGHQSLVLAVAFSPVGDQLASGGADNFARLWDVPSSKPSREVAFGGKGVKLAVSPDGKSYAAGGSDGKVRIFTAADAKPLAEIVTGVAVTNLAFTPNGQTLLSTGTDRVLRYWNATNGLPLASIGTGLTELNGLLAHASGNVVTTSTDGTMRVWPLQPLPAKKVADLTGPLVVPSPDGNTFAVLQMDKSIKLVNAANGQAAITIPAAAANIEAFAWNGDNATLAVASGGKVLLWGSDGKTRGEIVADAKAVRAVSFAASKTELLTGGDDGKLKLWKLPIDPKKPVEPKAVVADAAGVKFATMLPNGQAISIGAGKAVKAWDVNTGKEVRIFGTLPADAKTWTLSRDGALLAIGAGKSVKLWQTADGKELPFPALAVDVTSVAFSPDKLFLLVGTVDKTATIYAVATGLPQQFYPAAINGFYHPNQPSVYLVEEKAIAQQPVSFVRSMKDAELVRGNILTIPNTNSLLSLSATKTLSKWNVGNLQKEPGTELAAIATAFAVSKDGQRLATIAADGTVSIYTLNNNQLAGSFKTPGKVSELLFHPNGQSLAAILVDKTVIFWNTLFTVGQPLPPEFGSVVQTASHAAAVTSFAFLSEQQLLTGGDDGTLRVWRVASDQPSRSLQHPNLVDSVAFDKDGKQLATGCHDGIVRIFDLKKPVGTAPREIKAHVAMPLPHPIYVVAWSPDGKTIASGSFDKSIKLWDAASGNLVREIKGFPEPAPAMGQPVPPGHRDQVFCLAFSKDGKLLASGSSDRTIKLWDVATGNLVRDFPNPNLKSPGPGQPVPSHAGFVHAVKFAADGQTLISAGTAPRNSGFLAVWTVADGKLKAAADLSFGPVYSCELSTDGKNVLIGCGPKVRTASEAEAYVIPLPVK